MTDCFIYDAVRTPRGKGRKKDGALADATPLHLARTVLEALPERGRFESKEIEDVIFGCVEPVSGISECGSTYLLGWGFGARS